MAILKQSKNNALIATQCSHVI